MEAFLDLSEGLLLRSQCVPPRLRWVTDAQLQREAAAAAASASLQQAFSSEGLSNRLAARRLQQQALRERAREDAKVAAVYTSIPYKESLNPKLIEVARQNKLTSLGFKQVTEIPTPWRLNPNPPPEEQVPDLWALAMENEAKTWVRNKRFRV